MKAAPLLVSWHNDNTPIYSAHFEPHGKGRLATAGGDNNVRVCEYQHTLRSGTLLTVGSSGKSREAEKTEA
jgi:chromatin assembly factor 1 subunit B